MSDKIQKFINSLDEGFRELLKKKLIELREEPFKMKNVIKMKGNTDMYRLRVGKVRIIYILSKNNDIEVIDIDYRGNVY